MGQLGVAFVHQQYQVRLLAQNIILPARLTREQFAIHGIQWLSKFPANIAFCTIDAFAPDAVCFERRLAAGGCVAFGKTQSNAHVFARELLNLVPGSIYWQGGARSISK